MWCYLRNSTCNPEQNNSALARWPILCYWHVCACTLVSSLFQGVWSILQNYADAYPNQYPALNTIHARLSLSLFALSSMAFITSWPNRNHTKLYFPGKFIDGASLRPLLFLLPLPRLSFGALFCPSLPCSPCSVSVPTYYWWVDFTSHWCREGTVEYAPYEGE